jgi:hypothetical protein
MTTSNPTHNSKTAKSDQARIKDLPDSEEPRELTPDELKNIVGGSANDGIGTVAIGLGGGKIVHAPYTPMR